MIEAIHLENFKCFASQQINMGALTVLSGMNSVGKSTVIQSMLMLRQSHIGKSDKFVGRLNGPLVSLGYIDDVLYDDTARQNDHIGMAIVDRSAGRLEFQFDYEKGTGALPVVAHPDALGQCALFGDNFFYLNAERVGPRSSFGAPAGRSHRYNAIGNAGEYCAALLAEYERRKIEIEQMAHAGADSVELRDQVEAWLAEIGQNPRIHLNGHRSMDVVELQFSFLNGGIPTGNYRPTNVGFGLTYTLPIFVAGLLSKPGGLLLVENPEAHLHPKGQSAMGRFFAQLASLGVQVVVETHSDHVLNGIRVAVKRQAIRADQVALNYFYKDAGAPATVLATPRIDQDGRIDEWPTGFFDEWEIGLAELL